MKIKNIHTLQQNLMILFFVFCFIPFVTAQHKKNKPTEDDYYKIITVPTPEDILLEVGGLVTLPDGRIAVCTRRGNVWTIENPEGLEGNLPVFKLFASGLHEPLGLAYKEGALYAAQRGELTKLVDNDGDGEADIYETV